MLNWKACILAVFMVTSAFAQNESAIDSLKQLIKTSADDTNKVIAYNTLINEIFFDDPQLALKYSKEMTRLSEAIDFKPGIATGYSWLGYLEEQVGNVKAALAYYFKAAEAYNNFGDQLNAAACYNNIATIYNDFGNTDMALNYHFKALKIKIEKGETESVAISLNNMGLIYASQGKIREAMEMYYKALFISEMKGNLEGVALSLDHIGKIYLDQKHYAEALKNYNQAIIINRAIGDKGNLAHNLLNVGVIYRQNGELNNAMNFFEEAETMSIEIDDVREQGFIWLEIGYIQHLKNQKLKALESYNKALSCLTAIEDKQGMEIAYFKIGEFYLNEKNIPLAMENLTKSNRIAEELGFPLDIRNSANLLSKLYEEQGDETRALKYYKRYSMMKDSVHNDDTRKAMIAQQIQYEFSREQYEKEQEFKYLRKMEALKIERRNFIQYSFILLFIMVIFGLILALGFIKVPKGVAQGMVFVSLLLLFEFLLVFTDPYFDSITRGEPIWKLMINSMLALSIFPLHRFIERRLKKKIIK